MRISVFLDGANFFFMQKNALGGCPRIANSHIKDLFINRPEDEQIS